MLINQKGIDVKAMIRNPEQAGHFGDLDSKVAIADLEGDLSAAFRECNQMLAQAQLQALIKPC